MKKILRWVFIFFGSLILLLGIVSGIAWYYKPQLTTAIHEKLRENINGEFNIDDISVSVFDDFPHVSVTLDGIYLRGVNYDKYKKDFLRAEKVLVNVHLGKLLLKKIDIKSIRIVRAEVFIFKTKSGYTNLDIFKANTSKNADSVKKSNSDLLSLHNIYLDDVAIALHDSLKGKAFGVRFIDGQNEVTKTDSSQQFHYKGKIDFERLQFNEAKGSYLEGKSVEADLNVNLTPGSHTLVVLPSTLKFERSLLELTGEFRFVQEGTFALNIHSSNLIYSEGRSLLPKSLADKLERYDIDNPFELGVKIKGSLAAGRDPSIKLDFETKDAVISIDKHALHHVFSKGSFTNHRDSTKEFNDVNSSIDISAFEGNVQGFPVTLQASFHDLTDPDVELKAEIKADAKTLQTELDSAVFKLDKGTLTSVFNFHGKLNEYMAQKRTKYSAKLNGNTELKNMKLIWVPKNLMFENINASIAFTQEQFVVKNLSFLVNKSPVTLKGNIMGFVPFFTPPDQKGYVKLNLSSPHLNLTSMFANAPKTSVEAEKNHQSKMISEMIDNLYRRLEFVLSIDINHLEQHNFNASDVKGSLKLQNNQLQATALRMKLAGGDISLTFGLSELNKPANPLWIQAAVRKADIKEFFFAFNNFNQKSIDYKNLAGAISTNVELKAMLDDDFNVMMPSLKGNVDLTVRDGKLSNYAPLEKMSNFLFKNRDFSDVEFAEIKSAFDFQGTELSISRMEIESSVLSLFLEGRYSLADSTDLSIQIPLSNLKRHNKDFKPKNVGIDSKVGPSVFLRARPDGKGNMSITYDVFKKFRKR